MLVLVHLDDVLGFCSVYALGIYCDKGSAKKVLFPKYGSKLHPASSQALYDGGCGGRSFHFLLA